MAELWQNRANKQVLFEVHIRLTSIGSLAPTKHERCAIQVAFM
jgi:hypothetical protein